MKLLKDSTANVTETRKPTQTTQGYTTIHRFISIIAQIVIVPILISVAFKLLAGSNASIATALLYWALLLPIWVLTAIIVATLDTLPKKLFVVFVVPPALVLVTFLLLELS